MTLGLENKKKTGFLIVLALVCAYLVYSNVLAGPSVPASSAQAHADRRTDAQLPPEPASQASATGPARNTAPARQVRPGEFHPVLLDRRPENRPNVSTIDPTLRLEKLAKLQDVKLESNGRNLFQFGPPPPSPAELKAKLAGKVEPVVPDLKPPAPAPPPPPIELPPPPPPFKYYGLATVRKNGMKTAFFQDSEGVPILANEGEVVKKRYRVVRINQTSVTLEDVQLKRQQSLQISEDAGSAPG